MFHALLLIFVAANISRKAFLGIQVLEQPLINPWIADILASKFNCEIRVISAGHPQANGQADKE